jgi:hypothetical protein
VVITLDFTTEAGLPRLSGNTARPAVRRESGWNHPPYAAL